MSIDIRAKITSFFDREKIDARLSRMEKRGLSRAGAFIRRRMRQSIRRRKKISKPGSPPSSHTGDLKKILFVYDKNESSVVIGPIRFDSKDKLSGRTQPNILEQGGSVWDKIRRKHLKFKPRPFAEPALQAEVDAGTIPEGFIF